METVTTRLVPSTYEFSNISYLSITNESNMYTNTDSTTYATVTSSRASTSSYYVYLRGFNFNDIPSDAVVSSFTIKLKARETGVSTSSSYQPRICNGTTTLDGTFGTIGTTDAVLTCTGITNNFGTIKGYGSDFGIRINIRRASSKTQQYMYISGAEIEVTYTTPTNLYYKSGGSWVQVSNGYQKASNVWTEGDIAGLFHHGQSYRKKD